VAAILRSIGQPVWVVDQAGLIRFANPSAVATLGYEDAANVLGSPAHETVHYKRPDGTAFPVEDCLMLLPRITGEMIHGEDWLVRQDGSMFPVEYWSAPIEIPSGRGVVLAFTDVTERQRTEQALLERDVVLSALVQPVWVVTHDGTISYLNPAAVAALGFGSESEVIGQNAHWLVHYRHPDGSHYPIEDCALAQARVSGESLYVAEDWWVRRDGSMMPVSFTAVPIQGRNGFGTAVAFTDITERLATERAARARDVAEGQATELVASEARQRTILEAAPDGVINMDRQARITYANTAAEHMFGYQDGQMTGWLLADAIVPPSQRGAHRDGFARYLASGEPHILDQRIEVTAMRADGSEFPAELTVTRTDLPGSMSFTGFIRDITERQRAAQELMASRARLVAASDAARRRVTRDLHDGAQQHLVSTVISLQLARQKWAPDPQRARHFLDLALRDAQLGVSGLREIAAGIHPAVLTERGLATALGTLAGRLSVPVQLHLTQRRLPAPIEASIYFFCSEALTNVVKHARAGSAWVRVEVDGEQCAVEVRDDGIGGARAKDDGSGLTGLRDRIGALNGAMYVSSPTDGGTILRARIPLPAEATGSP
jgi:PAS domain S-box-containing protein